MTLKLELFRVMFIVADRFDIDRLVFASTHPTISAIPNYPFPIEILMHMLEFYIDITELDAYD